MIEVDSWMDSFVRSLGRQSKKWDEDYINASLNDRDQDPFDGEWVSLDKKLEKEKSKISSSEFDSISEKLRKVTRSVFIKIMKNTGSSDLAGYVFDDFDLIYLALLMKIRDGFLFSLIYSYMNGKIPTNEMERIEHNPTGLY